MRFLLSTLMLSILVSNALSQAGRKEEQLITIDNILGSPGKYNNEFVKIRGQVIQYSPGDNQSTASYTVQGEYGGKIIVTTMDNKPDVFQIYEVAGTVVIDPYTQEPYLIERFKYVSNIGGGAVENPLILFAFFIGSLAIAVIVVIYYVKKTIKNSMPPSVPAYAGVKSGASFDNDFKTIRMTVNNPKNLVYMPGKLVIVSGPDVGKELMISGFPSTRGNIVTVGRENVAGDKAYSHIQLTESTISRKQAEIIQAENRILLKNLSETNYTQLNGKELKPEQEKEITPNSVIRMGSLEFKYVV